MTTPAKAGCSGTTPLWIAARSILLDRGDDLFRCWRKAQASGDAEEIHDLRVASRRLREGLALFSPCYAPEKLGLIGARVKKLTRLLGEMRNTDEAIAFFGGLEAEPELDGVRLPETFLAAMREKREAEMDRLRNGLRKLDRLSLRRRYRSRVCAPRLFSPRSDQADPLAPLAAYAAASLEARLGPIRELLPPAGQKDAIEAQHRLRIAVKHFRYRMELLWFLLGDEFPRHHGLVKRYQELLGKMHDLDVFADMVCGAEFAPPVSDAVLACIGAKRDRLFQEFSGLREESPLEQLGGQVRDVP